MSCFNKSLLICDLASWWILSVLSHKEPKLTGAPLRGHLVISAPPCHTPWLACRKVGPGQIHQLDLILGPSSPTRTPDLFDSLDARPHVPTPHPIPMGLPSSSWMEAGGGGGGCRVWKMHELDFMKMKNSAYQLTLLRKWKANPFNGREYLHIIDLICM